MPAATSERTCTVDGCGQRHWARGLCQTHYNRDYVQRRKHASDSASPQPSPPKLPPAGHSHAAPVRAHLNDLKKEGISTVTAAALSGVPRHIVVSIAAGTQPYVRRDQALAIMRVHPHPEAAEDRAMISAHGAKRRIQALIALGWRFGDIAEWLDCHQSELSTLIHPSNLTISGRRHRLIAEMYRDRCMSVPEVPSAWSVSRAARESWVTPLAWDDIDRDATPPAAPAAAGKGIVDDIAVELALSGRKVKLRRADREEVVRIAHARRWSDQRIARVTGIVDKTVFRIRQDLGLPGFEMYEIQQ